MIVNIKIKFTRNRIRKMKRFNKLNKNKIIKKYKN